MNEILQKRIEEAATFLFKQRGLDKESCRQAMDYILANQWVSVEEALPTLDEKYDFSERYLVKTNEGEIKVMRIFKNIAWCDIYREGAYIPFEENIVTHWMPIPCLEGGEK